MQKVSGGQMFVCPCVETLSTARRIAVWDYVQFRAHPMLFKSIRNVPTYTLHHMQVLATGRGQINCTF